MAINSATYIGYKVGGVPGACLATAEGADPITSTAFEINPDYRWFRVHVEDGKGHFADTHAYYMSDLNFEQGE